MGVATCFLVASSVQHIESASRKNSSTRDNPVVGLHERSRGGKTGVMDAVAVSEVGRSSFARSLDLSLMVVGGLALLIGLGMLAFIVDAFGLQPRPLLVLANFWLYVGVGLYAWRRRPSNPTGALIVTAGFALFMILLGFADEPLLDAISRLTAFSVVAVISHILLAFPSGILRWTSARVLAMAGYVCYLGGPLVLALFDGSFPIESLVLVDDPDIFVAARTLFRLTTAVLIILTALVLVVRVRLASANVRRLIGPLFTFGIVVIVFVPLIQLLVPRSVDVIDARLAAQMALVAALPVVIAVSLLSGRVAKTGEFVDLTSFVSAGSTIAHDKLHGVLARTLGDPGVQLLQWSDTLAGLVDESGHRVSVEPGGGLVRIPIGEPVVGAIEYDPELVDDPKLVTSSAQLVALALHRERLISELVDSRNHLAESRLRIAQAAEVERDRIARNLHDGAQARLVLLGIRAQLLADSLDADGRAAAENLREQIDEAATELRSLVHGLLPAALHERGLHAAIDDLLDRVPLVTSVKYSTESPLPPDLEWLIFFVVSESVTNALKHGAPQSIAVTVDQERNRVRVDIADDGRGGATVRRGGGLEGLSDRVAAYGGSLEIDDGHPGTVVRAELPCT